MKKAQLVLLISILILASIPVGCTPEAITKTVAKTVEKTVIQTKTTTAELPTSTQSRLSSSLFNYDSWGRNIMTYEGVGYRVYYTEDWFFSEVDPGLDKQYGATEIRLTPPFNSVVGGIVSIRTMRALKFVGRDFYFSNEHYLRREAALKAYFNTIDIKNITIEYNGPLIRSLEYYNKWEWIITFNALYKGQKATGFYLEGKFAAPTLPPTTLDDLITCEYFQLQVYPDHTFRDDGCLSTFNRIFATFNDSLSNYY